MIFFTFFCQMFVVFMLLNVKIGLFVIVYDFDMKELTNIQDFMNKIFSVISDFSYLLCLLPGPSIEFEYIIQYCKKATKFVLISRDVRWLVCVKLCGDHR